MLLKVQYSAGQVQDMSTCVSPLTALLFFFSVSFGNLHKCCLVSVPECPSAHLSKCTMGKMRKFKRQMQCHEFEIEVNSIGTLQGDFRESGFKFQRDQRSMKTHGVTHTTKGHTSNS